MSIHVVIAGGGLGGLALAQALRKAGVSYAVYERDPEPGHRFQGYRIHIDAAGHAALHDCLPEHLYQLYTATSTRTPANQQAMFFDHRFLRTGVGDARVSVAGQDFPPTAVNRLTLREILLAELGPTVHFGREAVRADQPGDGVRVHFTDDTTAGGDVLVVAEGINSALRRELLPQATVHDTGVRAITGKTLLNALPDGLPAVLDNSFTAAHGPQFRSMALAPFRSRRPHREAAAELAFGVPLSPVPDYLMWLQLARVEDYPLPEPELFTADSATLQQLALDMLEGWHPQLHLFIERAEQQETFPLAIRAVLPVPPWPTTAVTLLGDAIHAMSPIGGRGANTALHDAASLAAELVAADRGEQTVPAGLARYEEGLRERGDAAVTESLRMSAHSIGARSPYGVASPGTEPAGTGS